MTDLGLPALRSGTESVPTTDEKQTGKDFTSDQEAVVFIYRWKIRCCVFSHPIVSPVS